MIRAIIFDMDGVLIEAKDWHYEALNRALQLFGYEINRADHVAVFDGLPTRKKLEILSSLEGLPVGLHPIVSELKQQYTMEIIHAKCKPVFSIEFALAKLKDSGLKLAVASNSIRDTVETMMKKSNLERYLDLMLSNEDVKAPKPDPEMYILAMKKIGVSPKETVIVEDNEHGIRAAKGSGAHVLEVRGVHDVNFDGINTFLKSVSPRQ